MDEEAKGLVRGVALFSLLAAGSWWWRSSEAAVPKAYEVCVEDLLKDTPATIKTIDPNDGRVTLEFIVPTAGGTEQTKYERIAREFQFPDGSLEACWSKYGSGARP
jgi:hypothetical protein